MKTKTIRINVEFPLDIPMRFDENGRPVHPFQLVAPYIDDFAKQTQYLRSLLKTEEDLAAGRSGEVEQRDGGYYEKMRTMPLWELREKVQDKWNVTKNDIMNILGEIYNPAREPYIQEQMWLKEQLAAERHKVWEMEFDRECHELYGMGCKDFNALSWEKKTKLREEKGVTWNGMKWVKEAKTG